MLLRKSGLVSDFRTCTACTNYSRNVKNVTIFSFRKRICVCKFTSLYLCCRHWRLRTGLKNAADFSAVGCASCSLSVIGRIEVWKMTSEVMSLSVQTWLACHFVVFSVCTWWVASRYTSPELRFTQAYDRIGFFHLKKWRNCQKTLRNRHYRAAVVIPMDCCLVSNS